MFHIQQPTEQWIDEVVNVINENQLKPEESKFMMAFFSSMDSEFVEYFQNNKTQISSFSGHNFQIPYLQPIITQYFIDNKSEIWLLFLIAHSKR